MEQERSHIYGDTTELQVGDMVHCEAGLVILEECVLDEGMAADRAERCTETHRNRQRVASGRMTQEAADEEFERESTVRAFRSRVIMSTNFPAGHEWRVQGNKWARWSVLRAAA